MDSCAFHRTVGRIPLFRLAAGLANKAQQFLAPHVLLGGGAGIVVNLLFHDSAVDVVGAEPLRNLRNAGRHHDPVRLDMRNVVEHQARNGNLLQVVESGGLR